MVYERTPTYAEFQILYVSHVKELAVLLMFYRQIIASLVLPRIIHHEDDRHYAGESSGDNDGNLRGNVLRGISVSESQGPNDVPDTYVFWSVSFVNVYIVRSFHVQKDIRRMAFIVTFFVWPA